MELVSGHPLNVVIKRFTELNASTASPARLTEMLHDIAPAFQSTDSEPSDQDPSSGDTRSGSGTSSTGRGRIYFRQVARWMADVADGMHYAHGEGIIHRDIKPGNLILSTDGRLMIADFGLAKDVNDESVTVTGFLLGTLRYMSPEQAMAKRMRIDHRTDIYSLGTTMYELLTFQPAISGADDKEILGHIITKDAVRPRKVVSAVPRDLETICLKAMEKSPDARYDTARALAEDLRRFISDLPVVAKRPGPVIRAIKFARRRRAFVSAIALLVIVSAAIPLLVASNRARHLAEVKSLEEQTKARAAKLDSLAEAANRYVGKKDWDAANA